MDTEEGLERSEHPIRGCRQQNSIFVVILSSLHMKSNGVNDFAPFFRLLKEPKHEQNPVNMDSML